MIKVTPYIFTLGSKRFREFLTVPFTIDMLYPIFNEKSCDTIFDGWRGKDMLTWYKFTNDENDMLEIFAETYNMCHRTRVFTLPLPRTINDFINDMDRVGIKLYWTNWIDINFEPKDYLHEDEIKEYFVNLLHKLDKSNELQ